jgi:15-cis-phytoene synthase/lycopene beta-cyclase
MSKEYLDLLYPSTPASSSEAAAYTPPFAPIPSTFDVSAFMHKRVPKDAQSAFFLVSTICTRIPRYPFDDLIAGYEWDLRGSPIVTQEDLVEYSRLVASSVAEMCVWAMWANEPHSGTVQKDPRERKEVLAKAASMGVALQITNIARDIREDATKGRIYIPQDWFKRSTTTTTKTAAVAGARIINSSSSSSSEKAEAASKSPAAEKGKLSEEGIEERARMADYANLVQAAHGQRFPTPTEFRYHVYVRQLLALAEAHKAGTAAAIRKLPRSCRPGIRAATQVYIGIGDEIRKVAFKADGSGNEEYDGRRISLTKWQRVRIALKEVYLRR